MSSRHTEILSVIPRECSTPADAVCVQMVGEEMVVSPRTFTMPGSKVMYCFTVTELISTLLGRSNPCCAGSSSVDLG